MPLLYESTTSIPNSPSSKFEPSSDGPKRRRASAPRNEAPRRSPRFLKSSNSPALEASRPRSKVPATGNQPTPAPLHPLQQQIAELRELLNKLEQRCSDLECQLTQKQDDLARCETQFDEFMVTFNDMSDERMDRDNELSDLRRELDLCRRSSQESTKAEEELAELYVQERDENANLQQRLIALGKDLERVSEQRANLDLQLLSLGEKAEGRLSLPPYVELSVYALESLPS
ncbi:hypothetical protein C8R46DRAFT_1231293 [Mycena filopes]|nr:hypothetical protein C8R46DRAFT_1231293 [Mycena filopes]